jgi:hypothetical protein
MFIFRSAPGGLERGLDLGAEGIVARLVGELVHGLKVPDLGDQSLPRLDPRAKRLKLAHHLFGLLGIVPKAGRRGKIFLFGYLGLYRIRVKDAPRFPGLSTSARRSGPCILQVSSRFSFGVHVRLGGALTGGLTTTASHRFFARTVTASRPSTGNW